MKLLCCVEYATVSLVSSSHGRLCFVHSTTCTIKSKFLLIFTMGISHHPINYETRIILPCKVYDRHQSLLNLLCQMMAVRTLIDHGAWFSTKDSHGTFKETCGKCGAAIFYWPKFAEGKWFPVHEGNETEFTELSVGLVDEEDSGARAERWVSWYDRDQLVCIP